MKDSTVNFLHSRVNTEEPIMIATCNANFTIIVKDTSIDAHCVSIWLD